MIHSSGRTPDRPRGFAETHGRNGAAPALSRFVSQGASRSAAPSGNRVARPAKAMTVAQRRTLRAGLQRRASGRTARILVLTRIFETPRELVFKAWTNAKLLARWWGPQGFTSPVCEADARPGGAVRIHMRAPDGAVSPMKGIFHEIVAPERLVLTMSAFEESKGHARLKTQCTVTLAEQEGRTALTLRTVVVRSKPEVVAALTGPEGWRQSLERLADLLDATGAAQDPGALAAMG
jgi:uncharacterized protein YndB with AHSA1/START domain